MSRRVLALPTPWTSLTAAALATLIAGCAQALTPETSCGDGLVEGTEVCEPNDLRGMTCLSLGYTGGALGCAADCRSVDTSLCTGASATCGNGVADGTEACDGVDLRGQTCTSQGFTGGALACNATCTGLVTSGCTGGGATCGNDVAEGGEACDGIDLRGQTCVTQGFTGGSLACSGGCAGFLTSGCTGGTAVCGNGQLDAGEDCDGAALGGATCLSEGYTGGTIACSGACTLDTSGCDSGGTAPAGWTCDETYYGDAACDCGCGALDSDCASGALAACEYSNCATGDPVDGQNWLCEETTPACGDGVLDAGEDCDGADLGSATCTSEGFTGGTLDCTASCTLDTSGCTGGTATCGDGVLDAGEDCDGADLGSATCTSEGFTGGTLDCTASCTLDTSGCTGGGTWTCSASYYGAGDGCDCGCGIQDTDCTSGAAADCDYEYCTTGSPVDGQNWLCDTSAGSWTCTASYYGDGECDCGCGVIDSDCSTGSAAECLYEWCSTGSPVDGQNWLCQ